MVPTEGYVVRVPRLRTPGSAASTTQADPRKTKSAEIERSVDHSLGPDDMRPTTGSSAVSSSSDNGRKSRSKNVKKTIVPSRNDPATASTDTLMDGWGDFDSDRLFRGERPEQVIDGSEIRREGRTPETSAHADSDERLVTDADADIERVSGSEEPKSQRQRLEELARRANKPSSQSNLIREVPKQVLRQRTLAVMELEAPEAIVDVASPTNVYRNTIKKPLISHRRAKKETSDSEKETYLPKIKKGSANATLVAMTSPRHVGLLGPHIEDSAHARTQVFERFLPVWSLMSSRGVSSFSGNGMDDLESHPNSISNEFKSPFECSMVLMKICKTIGISLGSSLAPDVWSCVKKRPGRPKSEVEFDSFCDFVVRNALQPALHHFNLDRDMDEYVHTVDTVVHSLLVKEGTDQEILWRIRELSEIQTVLPHWKKGILAIQRQNPTVKMSPSVTIISPDAMPVASEDDLYSASIVSVDEAQYYPTAPSSSMVAVTLPASGGGSTSTSRSKKLPAHEARAQQDANIRRKIQLRKSWQPRVVVMDPQQQQQQQHGVSLDTADVASDPDGGDALGSCMRVEAMAGLPNNHPLAQGSSSTIDDPFTKNNNDEERDPAEDDAIEEEAVLLLCGSCDRDEEATLWCSTCFAVYCDACWTSKHHSVVDMTMIHSHNSLPAPSARPMRTHRDQDNNQYHHKPPVDMIYLPTKPLTVGKRLRGSITTHQKTVNQEEDPVSSDEELSSGDEATLAHSFSSHGILPALRPVNRPRGLTKKKLSHHQSAPTLDPLQPEDSVSSSMDSTANLLKALMLGTASSASVLGSSASFSSLPASSATSASSKRIYKDPAKRKKLHPAAVTLDANALFQTSK